MHRRGVGAGAIAKKKLAEVGYIVCKSLQCFGHKFEMHIVIFSLNVGKVQGKGERSR